MRFYVALVIVLGSSLVAMSVNAHDGVDLNHRDRAVVFGHLYSSFSQKAGFTIVVKA